MSENNATQNKTEEEKAKKAPQSSEKRRVTIGLQGGGAHGAFTWGVIDKLLEDGRIEIEGLSGTSAGGMNALAVAQGLLKNGNQGGRDELRNFWRLVSNTSQSFGLVPSPLDRAIGRQGLDFSPIHFMMHQMSHYFSPYNSNPLDFNILRNIIEMFFDFDLLSKSDKVKLFLCATNVQTSQLKIFTNKDLNVQTLMATAALPSMSKAVEINGEYYWDGGFIGNPALFPLINNCNSTDLIVITLTPYERTHIPTTVGEIKWRMVELSLINSLVREMRAIKFVTDLIDQGIADSKRLKRIYVHTIDKPEIFRDLSYTSPLNSDWAFLEHLYAEGRRAADYWLRKNFNHLGKQSTWDLTLFSDQ